MSVRPPSRSAPSQFYTGLVAELYEPLVSERARAEDYVPFLERSGTPALELGCGTGLPLLDLVERGFEVEGLDASDDMLARCRTAAVARGLDVTLHRGEMQSFSLPRRYRTIFLAGATFTLLTTDADAAAALARIYAHLLPGGSVLIPLEIPDLEALRASVGRFRALTTDAGERLRVGMIEVEPVADGCTVRHRLRYERIRDGRPTQTVERDWIRRGWPPERFRTLLEEAGFTGIALRSVTGGALRDDASAYVALGRRSEDAARA